MKTTVSNQIVKLLEKFTEKTLTVYGCRMFMGEIPLPKCLRDEMENNKERKNNFEEN